MTAEDELVAVSYNIKSGRWNDQNRLPAIASALRAWDADIVLLQEVDNGRPSTGRVDMAADLAARLGMRHAFGANAEFRPGAELGNAILSRYPITDVRNTHLPNRPDMQQRGLLRATVEVEGRTFSVYSTHLQHTSASMRLEQARAIAPILAADPNPKIVGGDFNSGSGSAVMETVRRVVSDTWTEVGGGFGGTVPAREPRARIDYLLHEGVEPLRAEVMSAVLSDHRAVRAAYRITKFAGLDCSSETSGSSGG